MDKKHNKLCVALVVLLTAVFFFMAAASQAQQEEAQFTLYGVIKTVNPSELSFTLVTGEKIYCTQETVITDMANKKISFSTLAQPGKRVGAKVKDLSGKLTALSLRESGEG